MIVISKERFATGYQWPDYMEDIEKSTERFNENYAEFVLDQEDARFFSDYGTELNVLILGEDWCGDVVQSLPPIIRMLELCSIIENRIFKRDQHPDIMDKYLTDGVTKSIPYLVFMDASLNELATWGPRPADCQAIIRHNKGKIPMDQIYPKLRTWYKENGNGPLVREIREKLEQLAV